MAPETDCCHLGLVTGLVYSQVEFANFLNENRVIFWISLVVCISMATLVLLFRPTFRKQPINWAAYLLFTVSSAFVCAFLVAVTDSLVGLLIFTSLASTHSLSLYLLGIITFLFLYSLTVKKRLTY